jgi:8-oxo-dGTP pyrophosphatase MutT (NUDIX family)
MSDLNHHVTSAASEVPVRTFTTTDLDVALVKSILDTHQQQVWSDPEAAGGIDWGDCTNVGEDGWEGHNGAFTLHQAQQIAHVLSPPYEHGITAVALVLRGPLVLMVHRADGDWGPPGGKQNYSEPVGFTAARETHEETGLVIGAGPVVGVTEWFNAERAKHYTLWWIGCRYIDDERQPQPTVMEPDKHKAVRWVHLDELDSLPLTEPFVQFREQCPNWHEKVPQL